MYFVRFLDYTSILIFSLNATVQRCRYFFSHGYAQIVHFRPFFLQTYFIPIRHLYEGFEKRHPSLKHKMWQKIGLSITAQKIREHLPFEVRRSFWSLPTHPHPWANRHRDGGRNCGQGTDMKLCFSFRTGTTRCSWNSATSSCGTSPRPRKLTSTMRLSPTLSSFTGLQKTASCENFTRHRS